MVWTYRGPEAQCPVLLGHGYGHEHDPGEASPSQPSPLEPSQPSQPSPGELGASPEPDPDDPGGPDLEAG